MKKVPISIIIDDPAPYISVFYEHSDNKFTSDGREKPKIFPKSLLDDFCDVVERYGIKGKFSIVPMPGNKGDIVNGIEGVEQEAVDEWLNTVKERLIPSFTIGPEMLTHNKAVDLNTMQSLAANEKEWASDKDRTVLIPYITYALKLLKDKDFDVFGVTSPWSFGIEVEDEYVEAISKAVFDLTGRKVSWYFLRSLSNRTDAKPWVRELEEGRCVVSIPATTADVCWCTIENPDTSDEFVKMRADVLITEDGKNGQIVRVINTNGYPILITHWQALFSNGLKTGLRILEEVGRRIEKNLQDKVEWMSFEEIMNMVFNDKEDYPIPDFSNK